MRLLGFIFTLVCVASLVLAWDKEDYEIFDLQSAIEAAEGKGTTFYSWLEVPPTATHLEIAKAYRKKSVTMHPDKNPNVPDIAERYARLNVVQKILRSDGRERYDFFYKNGFPRWRGTGYYYARFRPGVGTVLVFLTLITAGMQYLVLRMNYKRDVARVEGIIAQARRAAWGPKLARVETRRKVKINLGGREVQYDEDGNEYGVGRSLELVVEGDNTWLLEGGELIPLDASLATAPSWRRTWPVTLTMGLVGRVTGANKPGESAEANAETSDEGDSEVPSGATTPNTQAKANGSAAGRRRKVGRK